MGIYSYRDAIAQRRLSNHATHIRLGNALTSPLRSGAAGKRSLRCPRRSPPNCLPMICREFLCATPLPVSHRKLTEALRFAPGR